MTITLNEINQLLHKEIAELCKKLTPAELVTYCKQPDAAHFIDKFSAATTNQDIIDTAIQLETVHFERVAEFTNDQLRQAKELIASDSNVLLFDPTKKKQPTDDGVVSNDYNFEQALKLHNARRTRLDKDRKKANNSVTKQYNLKKDK